MASPGPSPVSFRFVVVVDVFNARRQLVVVGGVLRASWRASVQCAAAWASRVQPAVRAARVTSIGQLVDADVGERVTRVERASIDGVQNGSRSAAAVGAARP